MPRIRTRFISGTDTIHLHAAHTDPLYTRHGHHPSPCRAYRPSLYAAWTPSISMPRIQTLFIRGMDTVHLHAAHTDPLYTRHTSFSLIHTSIQPILLYSIQISPHYLPLSLISHLSFFRQDPSISLNFEHVRTLHNLIARGYRNWVNNAPQSWTSDNFLNKNSPILITSRYGQNAKIALPQNSQNEADAWDRERDYSKVAFLTFAIATSIEYAVSVLSSIIHPIHIHSPIHPYRCYRIHDWDPIPTHSIRQIANDHIYDSDNKYARRRINIDKFPLTDKNGKERPVFDRDGKPLHRSTPLIDQDEPQCGVFLKLNNIHALFNSDAQLFNNQDDDQDLNADPSPPPQSQYVHIDAYPIAFLRSAGNIQASGIPSSFLPLIANINKSIRRHPINPQNSDDDMDIDHQQLPLRGGQQVLKPVASQFYNYIAHRTATRAGNHHSMKGMVTAAIAGGFAQTAKDRKEAKALMAHCDIALPSRRFKSNIAIKDCPSSCRAELVYSVDVRALSHPTGRSVQLLFSISHPFPSHPFLLRSIFNDIISPLANAWNDDDIIDTIKHYLLVLTPDVSNLSPSSFLSLSHSSSLQYTGLSTSI